MAHFISKGCLPFLLNDSTDTPTAAGAKGAASFYSFSMLASDQKVTTGNTQESGMVRASGVVWYLHRAEMISTLTATTANHRASSDRHLCVTGSHTSAASETTPPHAPARLHFIGTVTFKSYLHFRCNGKLLHHIVSVDICHMTEC